MLVIKGNTEQKAVSVTDRKPRVMTLVAILVWVTLLVGFSGRIFDRTIALDDGEEKKAILSCEPDRRNVLENGYYTVSPYLAEDLVLVEFDGVIQTETDNGELSQKIAIAEDRKGKIYVSALSRCSLFCRKIIIA